MLVHRDPVLYSIKKPRTSYVLKLQDQRKSSEPLQWNMFWRKGQLNQENWR